jgi:aminopeptidase N
MRLVKAVLITLVSVLIMVSCKPTEVSEVIFTDHNLKFDLNIEKSSVMFEDKGLMQVKSGVNVFYLTPNARVDHVMLDGKALEFKTLDSNSISTLDSKLASKIVSLDPPNNALWVIFKQKTTKEVNFSVKYSSVFQADVSEVRFSNQNVGREVTATIIDRGAYFSPSSYYYPRGNDGLMNFEVTAKIPEGWESIADGNSISSEVSYGQKIQSWKNPYQSDGLMFMAAPFVVGHVKANEIDVYCYFFEEDTSLFETYLPATAEYVKMYSDMIGPYPYERFTVAENFFPTGYGMPAWTLLGQQVIRLPFIVMTSLGHEVLHNWWGNSIYVDYDKGNWCEGLTVYGADYHYKLNRSPASARDYRKDILKQYKSYVTADNEFPVREFVARHNAESRTIGYNKTMMIFHMIENHVGTENFFQAWRDIYADYRGQKVTWEVWIQAFEKSSGENLTHIIPQWVDTVGAANLSVELLESSKNEGKTNIKLVVNQPENGAYSLNLPIKFMGSADQYQTVQVEGAQTVLEFTLDGDISAFELDPDYNVFRHLYPQEIEPIVAAVMGAPEKHFVYYSGNEKESLKAFGDNLTEGDVSPVSGGEILTLGPEGTYAIITLNPTQLPAGLDQKIQMNDKTITINGTEYQREGHTFVLSAEEAEISAKLLVVISNDKASLARVGQLIPHYGKYSYLVFKGSRNIGKGQWPALTSPLRKNL